MVCATITRDPVQVDDELTVQIRDGLHEAIVKEFRVKPKQVEMRVREVGPLDINSGPLAIDIDSGPGVDSWRIEECPKLILRITSFLIANGIVPKEFWPEGKSNIWIRIYAKGASMPIGRADLRH